jgi:manganese oxidase
MRLVLLSAVLLLSPPTTPHHVGATRSPSRASLPHIVANDNRRPAGILHDGVLTLHLVAQDGLFFPEGEGGRGVPMQAFAEEGKPPVAPAPLVRVPEGTELHVSVTNTLDHPLRLRGFGDRSRVTADSVEIAPGETRELRLRAPAPGTYLYSGRTTPNDSTVPATVLATDPGMPDTGDSQLVGALVVDPAGAVPNDRVFVLTNWFGPDESRKLPDMPFELLMLNGRSWPYTERLDHVVGDTVRWRVVNGTAVWHPMHLHGFHFRVDARGDGLHDTTYDAAHQRLAVTELMRTGSTMRLTWVPTRPGNWLFHCHLVGHIDPAGVSFAPPPAHAMHDGMASGGMAPNGAARAALGMAGLVLGVRVTSRDARFAAHVPPPPPARRLRLFVTARPHVFDSASALGFVLQEGPREPAADSVRFPGSTLEIVRGEPTEITVLNRSDVPVSVHWHGLEIDSYYDGVAGWSGAGTRTAPMVAPNDSFVVRLTPVRAGTFIYHTHADEMGQLGRGLYGTLVVREPDESLADDRTFLLSLGGPKDDAVPWLNGSATPAPITLDAGRRYRFRLVSLTPNGREDVVLKADTVVQSWRPIAKDGAALPPALATPRRASIRLAAGETADFEVTPTSPGALVLESTVKSLGQPVRVVRQPIVVRQP